MRLQTSLLLLCGCLLAAALAGCDPGDRAASTGGGGTPPANATIIAPSTPTANTPPSTTANTPGNSPSDAAKAPGNKPAAGNAPAATAAKKPADGKSGKAVGVVMETSKGVVEMELYPDKAPVTVKNFLSYVSKGFYDGTIFHRVKPGFMIQGGGFTPDLKEKPTSAPIKNEAGNGLKNDRGTVAMARTGVVDSATAQFFINVADNDFLNHRDDTREGFGYAVFGKVTRGMDVADKIVAVPTGTQVTPNGQPMEDVPSDTVLIKSIKLK